MHFTALPRPAAGSSDKPRERESGKLGRRVLLQNLQQKMAIGERAFVASVTLLEHWDRLRKRNRTFSRY